MFPKPDVGDEYAPTELCEKLMKHVDAADSKKDSRNNSCWRWSWY